MAKLETLTTLLAWVVFLETAQAVDILLWDGPSCSGLVQARCTALSNTTCCVSNKAYQSVEIRAESCQYTTAFKNGDCTSNSPVVTKNGSRCFHGRSAAFTAASWKDRCAVARSSRALLGERRSRASAGECARHVEVDDHEILFREDPLTGIWSLRLQGVTRAELLEELASVPKDERVFWLFDHGASYVNQGVGLIFDIVDV
ncbi:hypothetical protein MPTK2_3g11930 [Marchantia polymorpha subsp. ruderalis]